VACHLLGPRRGTVAEECPGVLSSFLAGRTSEGREGPLRSICLGTGTDWIQRRMAYGWAIAWRLRRGFVGDEGLKSRVSEGEISGDEILEGEILEGEILGDELSGNRRLGDEMLLLRGPLRPSRVLCVENPTQGIRSVLNGEMTSDDSRPLATQHCGLLGEQQRGPFIPQRLGLWLRRRGFLVGDLGATP
jgi:hypothetical protein